MSVLQYASAGAAILVALWPQVAHLPAFVMGMFSDDTTVPAPKPLHEVVSPNYQTAIANLAAVRLRLLHTKCLGDDQRKAIDSLTLALVDGSDQ